MIEDYRSAQRAGQRAYRANVARGSRPISRCWTTSSPMWDIVAQEPLGLVDIPAESIVVPRPPDATPPLLQFHASSRRRHRVCSQVVEPL